MQRRVSYTYKPWECVNIGLESHITSLLSLKSYPLIGQRTHTSDSDVSSYFAAVHSVVKTMAICSPTKTEVFVEVKYGDDIAKGKCTFAIKDIERGTRIIKEKPTMRFGTFTDPRIVYSQFLNLNPHERNAVLGLSRRIKQELYYLGRIRYDLSCVLNQSKSHPVPSMEEAAKVLAIYDDNQVQLQYESRPDVALQIARINHSCVPNVAVAWNSSLEMYTVHAIKDIKKDDEILYSYVYIPEPREKRQERLRMWEINCKCWACDFERVDMECQKQQMIAKDKSRPMIQRRSTGELNVMWYKQPTPQSGENRRLQWMWRNETMNRTNQDQNVLGRASTYQAMIDFLGPEDEMLEERVRL